MHRRCTFSTLHGREGMCESRSWRIVSAPLFLYASVFERKMWIANAVAVVRSTLYKLAGPAQPRMPCRTLLDAPSSAAVVKLVHLVARDGGAEDIAVRLSNLYARFLPDEPTLRRLSWYQQQHTGCDELAYCCTTVFAIAQDERARAPRDARRTTPRRTRSAPPHPRRTARAVRTRIDRISHSFYS